MEKLTLLIVEDDKTVVQLISNILENHYTIKVANDGEIGYKVYKKISPSIIISDISMPNLDGIKMVQRIRENDHNTKIILTTSHSDIEYLKQSISLKLTEYIVKPIKKDALLKALDNAVKEIDNYQTISIQNLYLPDRFVWNFKSLILTQDNKEINLSPSERKILNFLLSKVNNITTYDEIIYEISSDFEISTKESLKVIIAKLRKKIPNNLIENVYGIGYKAIL